jgi:hypothetical protein
MGDVLDNRVSRPLLNGVENPISNNNNSMHDDDGMRMTIRYYYDDERATPDSRHSSV